jgi:UDP-3-O-[3-hydroxymyristoyl] N-acetylglucosamine deacetylase
MPYQLTIQRPVETCGVGLHTAVQCRLRLLPAPADTGIVFRRVDLDNFEIEAHVRNVARVSYATSLMKQGVLLSTVEHLLAALYSCGVDNVYVEIDALFWTDLQSRSSNCWRRPVRANCAASAATST